MPLSQSQGENDIIQKLLEIEGIDIIPGEYVEDSYVPKTDTNGMFVPYITVGFDPPNSTFDNGIVSPAWDTQRAQFAVFVVSPSDTLTREYRDKVREKLLVDFRPTDGSYLKARGGYRFVDPDLGYHRYVQVLQFSYTFNLSPSVL